MRVTLTNDFHNSKTTINLKPDQHLSARRVKAIKNRLCGVLACTCSGQIGTRGKQADPLTSFDFRGFGEGATFAPAEAIA